MSTAKTVTLPKAVAIRLDPSVKAHLEALAAKDERSIAYLIRKAISDYLEANPTPNTTRNQSPEPAEGRMSVPDLETPVLTFRLSEALQEALEVYAKASGETVSEVVRQAITAWIASVDIEKLSIEGGQDGSN